MKFFTRNYHNSEGDEDSYLKIHLEYANHLKSITPSLTPNVKTYLKLEIQTNRLHDAKFVRGKYDQTKKKLILTLRCGDLQAGYYDLDISYSDVGIDLDLGEVKRILDADDTEILSEEIDYSEESKKQQHQLIFYPDGEMEISFEDIEFGLLPKLDRAFVRRGFQIV